MKKGILLFTLALLIFSTNVSLPKQVAANPAIEEVEQARKQVSDKLSKKESQVLEVIKEVEQLHEKIGKIEAEISLQNEHIKQTEDKVMEYEGQFNELVEETKQLSEAMEARKVILDKRLAAYQHNGGDIGFLEVILNAKSFVDFISRVSSVSTITEADRAIIIQQQEDQARIEAIQADILEKIAKQEAQMKELEETKAALEANKKSLSKSQEHLKNKEASLQKEIRALAKKEAGLNEEIKAYQKREAEAKASQKEASTKSKTNNKSTETVAMTKNQTNQSKAKAGGNSEKPKQGQESENLTVGKSFKVRATAYTAHCKGCSGYTARGTNLRVKNPPKVIAVDPSVIPLGSRVWVEGYGEAIADDTGGSIKGNRIDVFVKTKNEAYNWGNRTVTIKILQ